MTTTSPLVQFAALVKAVARHNPAYASSGGILREGAISLDIDLGAPEQRSAFLFGLAFALGFPSGIENLKPLADVHIRSITAAGWYLIEQES